MTTRGAGYDGRLHSLQAKGKRRNTSRELGDERRGRGEWKRRTTTKTIPSKASGSLEQDNYKGKGRYLFISVCVS